MAYENKVYMSWEEVHTHTKALCDLIRHNNKEFKGIVCVTRGGLVPCAIVASELKIKKIETFSITSYSNYAQGIDIKTLSVPCQALIDEGAGWLVIDELLDTGNTAKYIKHRLPKASFYCLYSKILEDSFLEGYVKYFPKETWIYLPWEIS
ncbi:Xanthine phosphoribosyltransferase [Candidatus Hepatincolaceae symbiont of Richtersius coronifer]